MSTSRPLLPAPTPLNTRPIEWQVVTPATAALLPPGWVLVALSPEDYEKLLANESDETAWINQAARQLEYYRGADDAEPRQ